MGGSHGQHRLGFQAPLAPTQPEQEVLILLRQRRKHLPVLRYLTFSPSSGQRTTELRPLPHCTTRAGQLSSDGSNKVNECLGELSGKLTQLVRARSFGFCLREGPAPDWQVPTPVSSSPSLQGLQNVYVLLTPTPLLFSSLAGDSPPLAGHAGWKSFC